MYGVLNAFSLLRYLPANLQTLVLNICTTAFPCCQRPA